jgi:putative membrane protein insertion efficiency factor
VNRVADRRPGPVARALLALLTVYRRWISPLLPPSCRFTPSCSAYAVEAVTVHGALRGTWLAARRLLKCGPWHPGGWDPVPPARVDVPHPVHPTARPDHTPAEE